MAETPQTGSFRSSCTDHPDLEPTRLRIEVTPGRDGEDRQASSLPRSGLRLSRPGEERPSRFVLPLGQFASLATVAPMERVLANAEPVVPPKPQRRSSHNTTRDGGPLVNYNDPESCRTASQGQDRRAGSCVRSRQPRACERASDRRRPPDHRPGESASTRSGTGSLCPSSQAGAGN